MRTNRIFQRLLHLQGLRVTGVRFGELGRLILSIERTFERLECPRCGRRRTGRESTSVRRWRHPAIWGGEVWLEGEIRRLYCRPCDAVVTEQVPWARHNSDFTRPFEDAVALLAQRTDKTAVARLTGVAWATVGSISERVVAEKLDPDRFTSLRRLGIDEISFRKHHKYLTVVTDHDTRRVVWVGEGKSADALAAWFKELGPAVCAQIKVVSIDMSAAFEKAIKEQLPNAKICFDHFHIIKLANEALAEVRRGLQRAAEPAEAKQYKGMRWALSHRFDNLPERHQQVVHELSPTSPLGRAYLMKEGLSDILRTPRAGPAPLKAWLARASRSRLAPFKKLAATLKSHYAGVENFVQERLANGLAEGMNNKIRLLSHRAYGFHTASPLIATIYLCCAGITLPHLQLV